MEVEYVDLEKLAENFLPRNVKQHDVGKINQSIDRFGFVSIPIVDKTTGYLAAGHGRVKTLLEKKSAGETPPKQIKISKGKWLVPVLIGAEFSSEKELEAYAIADNKLTEAGGWDYEGLSKLLAEFDTPEEFEGLGFDDKELNQLLVFDEIPEESEIPEAPEIPVSKPGDLWLLGDHRLLCGSSAEHGDVTRLVGEESASCMWTDPPYGVDFQRAPDSNRETSKGPLRDKYLKAIKERAIANDGEDEAMETLRKSSTLAFEHVLRPNSGIYVCHSLDPLLCIRFGQILQEAGFSLKQILIWFKKNKFVFGRSDYHARHEPIWYGHKKGDVQFGRMGKTGWYGGHSESTVFEVDRPLASKEHPTMKPIELIVPMIHNSTRIGDWVYEPFAGSGSTLIACEQIGRKCLAIELEPKYCDVIVKRWENATGGKAKLG